jgi:hypothetical protein
MVNYPYFKLRLRGPEEAPPLFVDCSTLPAQRLMRAGG